MIFESVLLHLEPTSRYDTPQIDNTTSGNPDTSTLSSSIRYQIALRREIAETTNRTTSFSTAKTRKGTRAPESETRATAIAIGEWRKISTSLATSPEG